MDTTGDLDYTSYVPRWLVRALREDGSLPAVPREWVYPAAILQTDISGFTALSERLAQQGPEGVEELTRRLNDYFGTLIDTVLDHGGDITKFAGDALLALWPVDSEDRLPAATEAAIRCGLEAQRRLQGGEGRQLAMRIGVAAGPVWSALIGGVQGCWETVVASEEVSLAGKAESLAGVGQVVVSPSAWGLVGPSFRGEVRSDGFVRALSTPPSPPAPATPCPPCPAEALRSFLPECVRTRVEAGQEAWLGELRRVSVLFLHLPGLGDTVPLEPAQEAAYRVQSAILRREGTVNKISVDNKGSLLLAVFGLPPASHEDDAARCVGAALEVGTFLRGLGAGFSLGVTTGRVFCGTVGNRRRREYTVLGTVVNLAARLMQNAPGDVLCDEATWLAARERFRFDALPALPVKGRTEPVPVYRPREPVRGVRRRSLELVGRTAERATISSRLGDLVRRGEGGAVILEGDAGIGKSRLLEAALEEARSLGLEPLLGEADAVEKTTAWFAWRPIFRRLFPDLPEEAGARREEVLRRLAAHPDLVRLAPLLNVVLPIELPDNEDTSQMKGQVRADNTEYLLAELLDRLGARPSLVVLEDGHWLDSASWALLRSLVQKRPDLLALLSTRPLEAPVPLDYSRVLSLPGTLRIVLEGLSREEALDLACRRLGVPSLPPGVEDLLLQRAEGNPFFSQELVRALVESGLLEVGPDGGRLVGNLEDLALPDTVQGVVTSRLDRLDPTRLMILKVASVVGRTFRALDFERIYPLQSDLPRLTEHLDGLEGLDLVRSEAPGAWSFSHVITQSVAYDLMLYAQRQELHGAFARWLEEEHQDDRSSHFAALAYHFERATVVPKALEYLGKAGEQALHQGAHSESRRFFERALELGTSEPLDRIARWELGLGKSFFGLGDIQSSRVRLEQATRLLGFRIPCGGTDLALALLREAARQAWHRKVARLPDQPRAGGEQELMGTAEAHGLLAEIYYFTNDVIPSFYAGLRSLNLAEAAGARTPAAAEYAARLAVGLSSIPIHSWANFYGDRALEVARDCGNLNTRTRAEWLVGLQKVVVPPRWDEAFALWESSQSLARRLGDRQNLACALVSEGYGRLFHSEFERSLEVFSEAARVARQSENRMHEEWGLGGVAGAALRLGRHQEAEQKAREALEIHDSGIHDPTEAARAWVNLALALQRQGDRPGALRAVEQARALLRRYAKSPSDYHMLDAYSGIDELFLDLWDGAGSAEERARWLGECRRALKDQRAYCRVFPWGVPRLHWTTGCVAWRAGRPEAARKAWSRGLQEARRLDTPYEEALCLRELGRMGQAEALDQARALLERLGAAHELQGILEVPV